MSDCDCTADCEGRDDCPSLVRMGSDKGTVFIERLEDGTVQLNVRSQGAHGYSFINLTWDEWAGLKSLDLPVPEPEVKF